MTMTSLWGANPDLIQQQPGATILNPTGPPANVCYCSAAAAAVLTLLIFSSPRFYFLQPSIYSLLFACAMRNTHAHSDKVQHIVRPSVRPSLIIRGFIFIQVSAFQLFPRFRSFIDTSDSPSPFHWAKGTWMKTVGWAEMLDKKLGFERCIFSSKCWEHGL